MPVNECSWWLRCAYLGLEVSMSSFFPKTEVAQLHVRVGALGFKS